MLQMEIATWTEPFSKRCGCDLCLQDHSTDFVCNSTTDKAATESEQWPCSRTISFFCIILQWCFLWHWLQAKIKYLSHIHILQKHTCKTHGGNKCLGVKSKKKNKWTRCPDIWWSAQLPQTYKVYPYCENSMIKTIFVKTKILIKHSHTFRHHKTIS